MGDLVLVAGLELAGLAGLGLVAVPVLPGLAGGGQVKLLHTSKP
jgi:hypothetical protein